MSCGDGPLIISSVTEQQIGVEQTLNTRADLNSLFFASFSFSTLLIGHYLTAIGRKDKELVTMRFKVSCWQSALQLYKQVQNSKVVHAQPVSEDSCNL